MKILITGATGHLGGTVIDQLLKKIDASNIFALTRDPQDEKSAKLKEKGVQIRKGNYDDTDLLEKAMKDIETVLLISAGDQGDRMQQHKNVIDAAKKMGVECIAYTSRSLKDRETLVNDLMKEHFLTEDYIKQSGLRYTIFRNALYMDVLPMFVGKNVFETGIHQPAGQGKVAYALRSEQGEAMANVLADSACSNKTHQFTANDAYTFDDVAKALSELSEKNVAYTDVEIPIFKKQMREKGLPEPVIDKILGFITDIKNGQEAETTPELEKKLGRKPATLKEGLKVLFEL